MSGGEIVVTEPVDLDKLLNEGSSGLRRYVPPEHRPVGWNKMTFNAPVLRDPEMSKPLSVARAREVIAMFAADLTDARHADGAERLVFELGRVFARRKSVFEMFLADVPLFRVAYKNLVAAEAELRAALDMPVSLDPAEAIARENRIVVARNALIIREREKLSAETLNGAQNAKLGELFAWSKPGGPRELARLNVDGIVKEALAGNVSEGAVDEPAEEMVRVFEPLWVHRACRDYQPTSGDSLSVEALRSVFDLRRDPKAALREALKARTKRGAK